MEEGIYIVPTSGLCGPLKVSVLVRISAEVLNPVGLAIAEKLHLPALYTDMGRDNFEPLWFFPCSKKEIKIVEIIGVSLCTP